MTSLFPETQRALSLADQIKPLLAGKGPDIQGAALAEIVALWLAGHFDVSGEETPALREAVLESWLKTVRLLVPVCESEILGRRLAAAEGGNPC